MTDPTPAILLRGVQFAYDRGAPILDIGHLAVARGERVFLRGPSGAGKSTLLGLIGGTLTPQAGEIEVLGQDMTMMGPSARDRFRADQLGIVFQLFNLIPYLSVVDNVLLPCRFSKRRRHAASADVPLRRAATDLLARLGLDDPDLLKRPVTALSVGQQQRVAAARALIGAPGLVIADEPTSALDGDTQKAFLSVLIEEVDRSGAALLFVSHDERIGALFERAVDLPSLGAVSETMT